MGPRVRQAVVGTEGRDLQGTQVVGAAAGVSAGEDAWRYWSLIEKILHPLLHPHMNYSKCSIYETKYTIYKYMFF